jgi:hypothetical protein
MSWGTYKMSYGRFNLSDSEEESIEFKIKHWIVHPGFGIVGGPFIHSLAILVLSGTADQFQRVTSAKLANISSSKFLYEVSWGDGSWNYSSNAPAQPSVLLENSVRHISLSQCRDEYVELLKSDCREPYYSRYNAAPQYVPGLQTLRLKYTNLSPWLTPYLPSSYIARPFCEKDINESVFCIEESDMPDSGSPILNERGELVGIYSFGKFGVPSAVVNLSFYQSWIKGIVSKFGIM